MQIYSALGQIAGNIRVNPVALTRPLDPRNSEGYDFGAAYVREAASFRGDATGTYGPDGRLRGQSAFNGSASGESTPGADAADERTTAKLEQRDRQVRRNEEAKGEAVGGSGYIYQTGPDGQRYAIGTSAHVVRRDSGDPFAAGASVESGDTDIPAPGKDLSAEETDLQRRLQARDAKVRQHEAAHIMAAGGQVHGGPVYDYQTGPDGRRYAVGGSVNISMTSFAGDDEAGVRQARRAARAATAAGDPSLRDMQAASHARDAAARLRQRALEGYEAQTQGFAVSA